MDTREKMEKEKETFYNIQNAYIEDLINRVLVLQTEAEKNKNIIEIINSENIQLKDNLVKLQEENNNLKKSAVINKYINHVSLIDDKIKELKVAYCKESEEAEELYNEVVQLVSENEYEFSYEDGIFLLYYSHFSDTFNNLVDSNTEIEELYSSTGPDIELLVNLIEEDNRKVGTRIEETALSFLEKNTDVLCDIDSVLRNKIIDDIKLICFRIFKEVYPESKIPKGTKSNILKAWVYDKKKEEWILTKGLYIEATEQYFLEDYAYELFGYKPEDKVIPVEINKEKLLYQLIEDIETRFINITKKNIIKKEILNKSLEINSAIDKIIDNIDTEMDTIALTDIYSLLYIGIFTGNFNKLITKYSRFRDIVDKGMNESILLNMLVEEGEYYPGKLLYDYANGYYGKKVTKFSYIKSKLLKSIRECIRIMYPNEVESIVVGDKRSTCKSHGVVLVDKVYYIKCVNKNNGSIVYITNKSLVCERCNSAYINYEEGIILKNKFCEYKILNDELNIKRVTPSTTYEDVIAAYRANGREEAKNTLSKFLNNSLDINKLNRSQKSSILLLTNILGLKEKDVLRKINIDDIISTPEMLLYNRLVDNLNPAEYLEKYKKDILFIDVRVKNNIFNYIEEINKTTSQGEIREVNLNEESDLRRLGYSVSLGREERWSVLTQKAIPSLGKSKVISHIRWLIKLNKNKGNMRNAVFEWQFDINRLEMY